MKVLLIGGGGREHAIAWKLKKSNRLEKLYVSPGNAGMDDLAEQIDLDIQSAPKVIEFCKEQGVDMVVIGPEQPLVDGLADHLEGAGIAVIGPSAQGAQLEGSKAFAKAFMARHNIPTAAYRSFTKDKLDEAHQFIQSMNTPIVLKADGLAAGKGVLICTSHQEAQDQIKEMFGGKFGSAGEVVVIEEFLDGIEFSVFVLTDGSQYVLLPTAKDYKRALDGDQGLNTGGMGTVSPVGFVDESLMNKVVDKIVEPTIRGLSEENINYKGFIFFGLINVQGEPFVIEYNARLGDPETQVILPRLKSDLLDLFDHTIKGTLADFDIEISEDHLVSVTLASAGYPESYEKGKAIQLHEPERLIFHAGTRRDHGQLLTSGGRVMACMGIGKGLKEAIEDAYACASTVEFEGKYYRHDIGQDVLKYV